MIEKEIMHCKTDADDWFIICPEKSQQGKSFEMNIYLIVSNIWNSVGSKNIFLYFMVRLSLDNANSKWIQQIFILIDLINIFDENYKIWD